MSRRRAPRRLPGEPTYRETDGPHIGFLGRIVREKGLEHLVRGFRALPDPDARLLIGGDFTHVAGGSVIAQVRAAIDDDPRVRLLGFVPEERLGEFYASLDVFTLPSVNAFEAFGIVQAVAMLAGVPVLSSDIPGVRQPVMQTGFGTLVPPADQGAITRGLQELYTNPPDREVGADRAAPGVLRGQRARHLRGAARQSRSSGRAAVTGDQSSRSRANPSDYDEYYYAQRPGR